MPKVVFYITSHGFGHATRAIEIISNLPDLIQVEVVTTAPRWLFYRSLKRPFHYTPLLHDCGVVQHNCVEQDLETTYAQWSELLGRYPAMAEKEAQRLEDSTVDMVIGDISPFTLAVAEQLDIPSVIVANFSWDWIFSAWQEDDSRFTELIEQIQAYYRQTTLLLRTPFYGDLSVFPDVKDIPLVVRRSKKSREEARRELGLEKEQPVVLISFGGLGYLGMNRERLAKEMDFTFLTFDPHLGGSENVKVLDSYNTFHPDVVRASDAVVAKLGYGLVSECVAHKVPIAYVPREGFLEYDVFEKELPEHLPICRVEEKSLHCESWDFLGTLLEAKRNFQPKKTMLLNGGDVAADRLCDLLR